MAQSNDNQINFQKNILNISNNDKNGPHNGICRTVVVWLIFVIDQVGTRQNWFIQCFIEHKWFIAGSIFDVVWTGFDVLDNFGIESSDFIRISSL